MLCCDGMTTIVRFGKRLHQLRWMAQSDRHLVSPSRCGDERGAPSQSTWYEPSMAQGSTVFRIDVELSNVDAGVYETLELRTALHPSEDTTRLVARVLAQCLAYEDGITVGRGLSEADDPALFVKDGAGNIAHWIDVGYPSAERLHRASKAALKVTVLCHKAPDGLVRIREKRRIHNVDQIVVFLISPALVQSLADSLERGNQWNVVRTGEDLLVTVGDALYSGACIETTLANL